MTPAARVQAAIEILDRIATGEAAEKALTNWARASRFAGSKDRAAVRDHVFDVLRRWRSTAVQGGAETGRGRMIGLLRQQDQDLEALFSGQGHGPAALTAQEQQAGQLPHGYEAHDLPDWIGEILSDDLGERLDPVAQALRQRAPVFLRVNLAKTSVAKAQETLLKDGIKTQPHALSDTALEVTEGPRKVASSEAYQTGQIELQDAASQSVVDALPLQPGLRVLDYCAGGGGKTLAMAGRQSGLKLFAHDAAAQRMKELPARAKRAGARVTLQDRPKGLFDLVLCDVPCSGSGSWRRAPDAKWRFSQDKLETLVQTQQDILRNCAAHVDAGGTLAYATCSLLRQENEDQSEKFLRDFPQWEQVVQQRFFPDQGGDGFYVALFQKRTGV
ncbi:MAG: RsmB/NOP family class I SAM-dependent RNA methyltransferase [Pelagimonas sp.]|jgi:16S rRNA (cytosine967-C5)-methyltransferase|nr:RsmB/NOP family class I SAM-dependent RNA methyltransferase [Pelagimonas sp.]